MVETHAQRWHRINNLLGDLIAEADGTTAGVQRVVEAIGRMKRLDRTYAVRNLATRAAGCQQYHAPRRWVGAQPWAEDEC